MRKNYFLVLLAIVFTMNGMAQNACNLLAPTVTSSQSYVCMGPNGYSGSISLKANGAKGQEKYKWYDNELTKTPFYSDSVYNFSPNSWKENNLVFEGDTLVKYFWVSISNGSCESVKVKFKSEVIITPRNFNEFSVNNSYCSGDIVNIKTDENYVGSLPNNFQIEQYRYRQEVLFNDNGRGFSYIIGFNSSQFIPFMFETINETRKIITKKVTYNTILPQNLNKNCAFVPAGGSLTFNINPNLYVRCGKTTSSSIEIVWDTITPTPTGYEIGYTINRDTTRHKVSLDEVYKYKISNLLKGDTVSFSVIPLGIECNKISTGTAVAEDKIIPTNIPTQNLIGWWPFNGNAYDESGNGNNGEIMNFDDKIILSKDRFGNNNKGYEFKFGNDGIRIKSSAGLRATSITLSGWFKIKNPIYNNWEAMSLISKQNSFSILIPKKLNTNVMYLNAKTNSESEFYSKNTIDTNTWHHFVLVHDEKIGSKMYINGKLESSTSNAGMINNTSNSLIFGVGEGVYSLNGFLDDIAIFNTALDSTEIKALFYLTSNQETASLIRMNESCISLYPNPTSDVLHIEIGDAKALEGYRYRILDALGKEVYNELVKNALTEIPLKTLGAAGMYQLEVLDANKTSIQTNKIVLQ